MLPYTNFTTYLHEKAGLTDADICLVAIPSRIKAIPEGPIRCEQRTGMQRHLFCRERASPSVYDR